MCALQCAKCGYNGQDEDDLLNHLNASHPEIDLAASDDSISNMDDQLHKSTNNCDVPVTDGQQHTPASKATVRNFSC